MVTLSDWMIMLDLKKKTQNIVIVRGGTTDDHIKDKWKSAARWGSFDNLT